MTMSEKQKKCAVEFYRMAYLGEPRAAVEAYVGDEYIQHNPDVGNGREAFIEYFERMHKEYPDKSIDFVRVISEGDLVAVHTHQIWPGNEGYITMDFFRFDTFGKIIEHWDAIQKIPLTTASGNTMY